MIDWLNNAIKTIVSIAVAAFLGFVVYIYTNNPIPGWATFLILGYFLLPKAIKNSFKNW